MGSRIFGEEVSAVAFHGDFAKAHHLQHDMGDPPWVDRYVQHQGRGRRDLPDGVIMNSIPAAGRLVLLGFSDGGDTVARLSQYLYHRILCAIVYESPVKSIRRPAGNFPVLMLWNEGSNRRYSEAASIARARWTANPDRVVAEEMGEGGHTKFVRRPSTWWRGHGWDVGLNPLIVSWVLAGCPEDGFASLTGSLA